jgi:hypothetical protein
LSKEINLDDLQNLSNYINIYEQDQLNEENFKFEISAKTISNLFLCLYYSTYLKQNYSELILSLLTNNKYDIKHYANINDDLTIAHKYGSLFEESLKEFHDCGILYYKKSKFLYCIMTKDIDSTTAPQVVGDIFKVLFDYIKQFYPKV